MSEGRCETVSISDGRLTISRSEDGNSLHPGTVLQDTKTSTGETEVKFQVSKDTLGSMLRSMNYIQEQL
ncbi:hypothetical protein RIF29_18793 [Crotalaria pallida]|uniref:Uncharacterized protein n=1 Tax=Crotalaria pallida TaxID=3830 RepID=A0AAN9EZJ1_CROPI